MKETELFRPVFITTARTLYQYGKSEIGQLEPETPGSSGIDLRYIPEESEAESDTLLQLQRKLYPTGIRLMLPVGIEGQVRPRSGLAFNRGITVLNTPGTIDSDYRGEIQVLLVNLSSKPVQIEPYERIAQLVLVPIVTPNDCTGTIPMIDNENRCGPVTQLLTRSEWRHLGEKAENTTSRGEGGFGSTD